VGFVGVWVYGQGMLLSFAFDAREVNMCSTLLYHKMPEHVTCFLWSVESLRFVMFGWGMDIGDWVGSGGVGRVLGLVQG
jgi:hypothetical protein